MLGLSYAEPVCPVMCPFGWSHNLQQEHFLVPTSKDSEPHQDVQNDQKTQVWPPRTWAGAPCFSAPPLSCPQTPSELVPVGSIALFNSILTLLWAYILYLEQTVEQVTGCDSGQFTGPCQRICPSDFKYSEGPMTLSVQRGQFEKPRVLGSC